jgi:hypothetical protein
MGVVYKARDIKLKRIVALKLPFTARLPVFEPPRTGGAGSGAVLSDYRDPATKKQPNEFGGRWLGLHPSRTPS